MRYKRKVMVLLALVMVLFSVRLPVIYAGEGTAEETGKKLGLSEYAQHRIARYYAEESSIAPDFTGFCVFGGFVYCVREGSIAWNYSGRILFNGKAYQVMRGVVAPVESPENISDEHTDSAIEGKKVFLLGDSRTVMLYYAMTHTEGEYTTVVNMPLSATYSADTEDATIIAKGEAMIDFFTGTAVPLAEGQWDENTVVGIWFGVNDPSRYSQYIAYVNTLAYKYPSTVFVYFTLGPCDGEWAWKQPEIQAFNAALYRSQLVPNIRVLDVYTYIEDGLSNGSLATLEGIHYDYYSSRAIYNYMFELMRGM